jgi:hypothetical protein
MNIGVEQCQANLAERIGNVGFADFALPAEVFKNVLKFIGESAKHAELRNRGGWLGWSRRLRKNLDGYRCRRTQDIQAKQDNEKKHDGGGKPWQGRCGMFVRDHDILREPIALITRLLNF